MNGLLESLEKYFEGAVARHRRKFDAAVRKGISPRAVAGKAAAERAEYFLNCIREELKMARGFVLIPEEPSDRVLAEVLEKSGEIVVETESAAMRELYRLFIEASVAESAAVQS